VGITPWDLAALRHAICAAVDAIASDFGDL
jgi:hypothetical protein